MNVLSLFSGVGGFDLGLEAAGMRTVALCEIDKNCRKVLRRHWPETPIYEDVSTLTATQLLADGVRPDVVAFGSPCQDLSVAGKRAGLAGSRSGLFGEAMRIIRELRKETNNEYPTWAIWENVVGALNSTRGDDFAAVIDSMADAGAMVIEWAVLDAQNFGVPQRRRRIFLVACFDSATSARCPDPLLPVAEGSPRDLAAGRQAGKATAGEVASSIGGGGYTDENGVLGGTVTSKWAKGSGGPVGDEAYNLVTEPTLMRQREGKPGGGKCPLLSDTSLTLATGNDQFLFQPVGFSHTQGLDPQASETHFPTLRAKGNGQAVGQPVNFDEFNFTGGSETHHTLRAGAGINSTGAGIPLAVRRLTPVECERLMGWPDDHTRWAADGTEIADSNRYKMCGNGIASPVTEWVGRHIMAVGK